MRNLKELFKRLSKSKFRSSFKLKPADVEYVKQKGIDTIEQHARDFILKRLAPAEPKNDPAPTWYSCRSKKHFPVSLVLN
jgi:hypothetical protein